MKTTFLEALLRNPSRKSRILPLIFLCNKFLNFMSKTTPYLKDNTFNTFYTTQINPFNDTSPFSIYKRHF